MRKDLEKRSKEELIEYIEDISKLWLTIDGIWFLSVEENYGSDVAIQLDEELWQQFSPIEAKRIMKRFNISENGGIPALVKALKYRVYANINKQEIIEISEKCCIFRMNNCRVQAARKSKNLPDFPCKSVGLIEYSEFAKTIDPRIKTKCLTCPPDNHPQEYYCAWEFTLED